MAVNVSARQLAHPAFVAQVDEVLRQTGLAADCLELELTESSVMRDPDQSGAVLRRLSDMGISLALDDFGTGYSSLAYLKRLPINYLKIDRSFIAGLPHDPNDVAICRTIIAMAKTLNIGLIAEGVENEDQRRFLAGEACDDYQGFLFSRPLPADDFDILLKNR
jgi:EAL domain-containing protein (putative c-di-GMP-specific phosphodiesterase class I)